MDLFQRFQRKQGSADPIARLPGATSPGCRATKNLGQLPDRATSLWDSKLIFPRAILAATWSALNYVLIGQLKNVMGQLILNFSCPIGQLNSERSADPWQPLLKVGHILESV